MTEGDGGWLRGEIGRNFSRIGRSLRGISPIFGRVSKYDLPTSPTLADMLSPPTQAVADLKQTLAADGRSWQRVGCSKIRRANKELVDFRFKFHPKRVGFSDIPPDVAHARRHVAVAQTGIRRPEVDGDRR